MPPAGCPTTDVTLLLRLRDHGDAEAWQRFLDGYLPAIAAWCARKLPASDAADVADAILCKLVERLPRFDYDRGKGQFRKWLSVLVHNVIVDYYRRPAFPRTGRRVERGLDARPDPSSVDEMAADLHDQFLADLRRLEQALAAVRSRVEPHAWEVFRAVHLEGQKLTRVVDRLGLNYHAAYRACRRILDLLKAEARRV